MICELCKRDVKEIHRHHITPQCLGGVKGETLNCCTTCSQQIHMFFTERELNKMSIEDLKDTEEMKKYINWIKTKPRDFSMKLSKRVKNKKYRKR